MINQPYECELCSLKSTIHLEDDTTVLAAINKIKADHAKKSPTCTFNVNSVIVHRPPDIQQDGDPGDDESEAGEPNSPSLGLFTLEKE